MTYDGALGFPELQKYKGDHKIIMTFFIKKARTSYTGTCTYVHIGCNLW